MKIRESVGQSVWNALQGWRCEPLDPIPPDHVALAIETESLDLVDWDIEEIGERVGFDIQYRYTGVNDPKDSSLACAAQFVGIYGDKLKMQQDIEVLVKAGIPRHLFRILSSNQETELKPFHTVSAPPTRPTLPTLS
ncbi:MAG: hypothetical protein F6J92_12000 [Symploca sp. SIO1A3]|nr:hypothetical protein [Symploca sp. SIO1A3]